MSTILQARLLATSDLSLLAYAKHMADTARTDVARKLFELFMQKEIQRLKAGGLCLSTEGNPSPKPTAK